MEFRNKYGVLCKEGNALLEKFSKAVRPLYLEGLAQGFSREEIFYLCHAAIDEHYLMDCFDRQSQEEGEGC